MRNHLAICSYLSWNCINCQSSIICNTFFFRGFGGFPADGEYFRAHVPAWVTVVVLVGARLPVSLGEMQSLTKGTYANLFLDYGLASILTNHIGGAMRSRY